MMDSSNKKRSKIVSTLYLLAFFSFLYIPMIVLIVYSFNSSAFPSPWQSFTFDWYKKLFAESELWSSFINSTIVAISSSALCILLTVCLLFFLSRGGKAEKAMNFFYTNLVFPETVLGTALLSFFTLLNIPPGLTTITIAHTIIGLGFALPVAFLRYREINPIIFEASKVLGASSRQTFFRITLPLMKPILITFGLVIFILSFDDFILSYFCSGASTRTLSLYLVSSIRYEVSPTVNALASLLLIFTLTIVSLFFFFGKRARRVI